MRCILTSALNLTSRSPYSVTCAHREIKVLRQGLATEDLVLAGKLGLQTAASLHGSRVKLMLIEKRQNRLQCWSRPTSLFV